MDMLTAVTKVDHAGGHPYLPVIVGFARHCAEDVAGIVPRKQRLLFNKYRIEPPVSEVSPCHQWAEKSEMQASDKSDSETYES